MVILLPILFIPKEILLSAWIWESLLPSTALSLGVILFILTLGNMVLNRPYLALFFGCHQKKDRSPMFFHKAWVLCTRCTGIYLGIIFMIISYWFILPWWVYLIFALPLAIDGILQQKGILSSSTPRRWITGILFGFFLVFGINLMIYGMMTIASWIVGFL
jgi:uncharacterized membrane protein